jgi:hypothetical protein
MRRRKALRNPVVQIPREMVINVVRAAAHANATNQPEFLIYPLPELPYWNQVSRSIEFTIPRNTVALLVLEPFTTEVWGEEVVPKEESGLVVGGIYSAREGLRRLAGEKRRTGRFPDYFLKESPEIGAYVATMGSIGLPTPRTEEDVQKVVESAYHEIVHALQAFYSSLLGTKWPEEEGPQKGFGIPSYDVGEGVDPMEAGAGMENLAFMSTGLLQPICAALGVLGLPMIDETDTRNLARTIGSRASFRMAPANRRRFAESVVRGAARDWQDNRNGFENSCKHWAIDLIQQDPHLVEAIARRLHSKNGRFSQEDTERMMASLFGMPRGQAASFTHLLYREEDKETYQKWSEEDSAIYVNFIRDLLERKFNDSKRQKRSRQKALSGVRKGKKRRKRRARKSRRSSRR